jgi:hypothetical protein
MKILLIILSFVLVLFLLPFITIIALFSIPFIFIYYTIQLFKGVPKAIAEDKKENSFFDFVIKHKKEISKAI